MGRSIRAYAAYLDTLEEAEDEHPACTANRLLLEHTWQVVANEFFDASGRFSQARPWFAFLGFAHRRLSTLQHIMKRMIHCSSGVATVTRW